MKVLLTSDLDRTLIFSNRTKREGIEYVCIEQLDGKNMSYMSTATFNALTKIAGKAEFIPVTTRSLKQYERITVFQQAIRPQYAVTSNGGVILKNGVVDEAWQQYIQQEMAKLPLLFEDVQEKFNAFISQDFVLRLHEVEALFFVLIVNREELSAIDFENFKAQLKQASWTCHLQGKKLYVLPSFLTKGAAVAHIKGMSTYDWHAAAGDSELDISMLEVADRYFIPQHAEIAGNANLTIMKESSSDFSDAYLEKVMAVIEQK